MSLAGAVKRVARALVFAALAPFAPMGRASQAGRLVVLAYHDPAPETLASHLAALSRHYRIVPLHDSLAHIEALPGRPLAITIDDGRVGNARLADACRSAEVRPTIFACTGVPGRFWWSGMPALEQRRLKYVPDAERRRVAVPPDDGVRETFSAEEIRELAAVFDFEPHTRTHPVLPRCDDAMAADEIAGSKADLEAILGRTCEEFAYPNGDFSDRDVSLVEAAGYRYAFTTRPGANGPDTDRFRMHRMVVRDDAPAWEVLVRASGMPGRLQGLLPRRLWSALQVR